MKRIILTIVSLMLVCVSYAKPVKGRVQCDGKGVAGVVVSDGFSTVLTDSKGRFHFEQAPQARFVFISTPSGYISSLRGGDDCYWRSIEDGRKRYDFALRKNPRDDSRHNLVVIADPQISDADEFPSLRHNAAALKNCYDKISTQAYTFGLCLGDIVGWNHSLYPEYNSIMDSTGIEWRNVMGNHDMTNYGRSFEGSTRDYEKMYGPSYYSFNVGKVHYIVLNNNFYVGKDWYYIGYLTEQQLSWMERDLSYVGKDKKVVVSLHIPTTLREWDRTGYNFNFSHIADVMCNRKAVYDILAPYDALILSGHTHTGNNEIIAENLMEHNVTSLGGAWWCGPVCVDGGPAGYKIYNFDGADVKWRFTGCDTGENCQMKVYWDAESFPGEVVANVWDYDPQWKVEYFEDGVKVCDMKRFEGKDPYASEVYRDPSSLKRGWVCAVLTQNLFRAPMSGDAKSREVRVTDRFGNVFSEAFESTGVLVVGGGASGVAAGIQAARCGAKSLIIEECPWLGGMLTAAGVSAIDGNYNMRSGIFGEFCDRLAAHYGGYEALKSGWVSNILFEPHVGNEIFHKMASEEKNLGLRHGYAFEGAEKTADGWTVHFEKYGSEGGDKLTVRTKVLIDASELGDVAAACGVKYRVGMDSRGETGEDIAPEKANDIVQDMTYVAILKDYGPDADMTIARPEGYDADIFVNSCKGPRSTVASYGRILWSPQEMIDYGRLPGGKKYMLNWPIDGNDYYANVIEMSPEERSFAYEKAKNITRCFLYYIQTELGFKNLGIADDEFPTSDGFPFIPYHREARRIEGEVTFTVDHAAKPFDSDEPLYRTGIAVGDYPIDHHHYRNPDWDNLPELHFYPIPSFNVPMGSLIPKAVDDLIVAEKSISVTNIMNGSTRLQPVVMQIGQAAGVLAALAVEKGEKVRDVPVREVQDVLLASGAYIMPYLDLKPGDENFEAIQRIGATDLIRGVGRNVDWSNQTWFAPDDPSIILKAAQIDRTEDPFHKVKIDLHGREVEE